MKYIITALFILFLSACFDEDDRITYVRVLDEKFKLITEFNNEAELKKIEQIWESRNKIKSNLSPTFKLKIDIYTENERGNRWLYDPNGYCMVLSKVKVPIYHIKKYKELNQMINP